MEYRRALAASFLFKFYVATALALERDTQVTACPLFCVRVSGF